jgi:hypothetical protein
MSRLAESSQALPRQMIMTKGRHLVWKEETREWICSECAWVFEPRDLFAEKSLNKYYDVVRREEEFAAHLCANHPEEGKP